MNELQIFNSPEFGDIRTVEIDGKPYFVANDVAKSLGYKRPADAVTAHCKGSVKHRYLTEGGEQEVKVIPEGDVYRLISRSKLPSAEKFERWVFDEVIPSIRKHGAYMTEQVIEKALTSPDFLIQLATQLKEEQEKRKLAEEENVKKQQIIEEQRPKVEFFDAVADSKTAISMNEVAKVINIKGYGRNKLFEFLRNERILDGFNVPYQRYVDCGWFRVIEQKYMRNGEPQVTTKTLVYQKGVDAIRKKLLKSMEEIA